MIKFIIGILALIVSGFVYLACSLYQQAKNERTGQNENIKCKGLIK